MSPSSRQPPKRARRGGRLFFLLLIAGAIAAILYLRCGGGWGFGKGGGAGIGVHDDTPESAGAGGPKTAAALPDAGIPRCVLRLDATGISVDGRPVSIEEAVATCKKGGADVVVTGDARQGDWDALRARLETEGIPTFVKGAPESAPADAAP